MNDFDLTRRGLLRAAALSAMSPLLRADEKEWSNHDQYQQRMRTFLNETDTRPDFVWMNREDVFYHDTKFPPPVANAPECRILVGSTWVFNRAMQWVRENGAILCYENAGLLPLTGQKQVSAWHTGADNSLKDDGEFTSWTKRSNWRRDCAVLPAFQFHAGQHSVLELEVSESDTEWQFSASLKGRSGPPLFSTPWHSGPVSTRIDLAAELIRKGFDWNYPEIHFAIGTWHKDPSRAAALRFRIGMLPKGAVVGCLPVIRTAERAKSEGVPLVAAVLDRNGRFAGPEGARLSATLGGRDIPLKHDKGLWTGRLHNAEAGDYRVDLSSSGSVQAQSSIEIRITNGRFFSYDKNLKSIVRDGRPIGPVSGSYQGTFYFKDAGASAESMVQGQQEWNAWDKTAPEAVRMHFWESLKTEELEQRFRYLAACGWDLLTLHQHWGDWERLDAGGRIAPHGAEQLARYLRLAGRYDLAHIQALSSGPYGSPDKRVSYGGTIPYSRYLEEGFHTDQFFNPGSHFDDLFHQYLKDFATLFSDETALFAMTGSGEGDHFAGPPRTNDTSAVVRSLDKNHMFFAETVLELQKLPMKHSAGFEQELFGGRTYFIANAAAPEYELAAYFKFLRMAGMYLAEGSWPPMPDYVKFHQEVLEDGNGSPRCWTGTPDYRLRWRDTLYLALVHRIPVTNSWDEQFSEDEHLLFKEIRDRVDWRQPFAEPPVALRVDDSCANISGNRAAWCKMAQYEEALSHLGVMSRYISADEKDSPDAPATINAVEMFQQPRFHSEGGSLPDSLKNEVPLAVDAGYATSHLWSKDRRTLLAYAYNTANHKSDYMWLCGTNHRKPMRSNLRLQLQNLPSGNLSARIYNLETKALVASVPVQNGGAVYDLGATDHDYFVLVTPAASSTAASAEISVRPLSGS